LSEKRQEKFVFTDHVMTEGHFSAKHMLKAKTRWKRDNSQ